MFLSPIWLLSNAGMVLSTVGGLMSSSFFLLWVGLEVNMLSFVLFLHSNQQSKTYSCSKYFVAQSLGSLVLISAITLSVSGLGPLASLGLVLFSVSLKSGVPPFHWWLVSLFNDLQWDGVIWLSAWQKILPLYLMMVFNLPYLSGLVALSVYVGSVGLFFQVRVKKLMAYSSILSGGWLMSVAPEFKLGLSYLAVYLLGLYMWITYVDFSLDRTSAETSGAGSPVSMKALGVLGLFSLAGFPPLLGFFLKLSMLQESAVMNNVFMVVALIASSPVSLLVYTRLLLVDFKILNTQVKPFLTWSLALEAKSLSLVGASVVGLLLILSVSSTT